jgi:hypothetical protein
MVMIIVINESNKDADRKGIIVSVRMIRMVNMILMLFKKNLQEMVNVAKDMGMELSKFSELDRGGAN